MRVIKLNQVGGRGSLYLVLDHIVAVSESAGPGNKGTLVNTTGPFFSVIETPEEIRVIVANILEDETVGNPLNSIADVLDDIQTAIETHD
jgi:hypothetical protein